MKKLLLRILRILSVLISLFLSASITHYIMETVCRDSSNIMDWMVAWPLQYWMGLLNIFCVSLLLFVLTGRGNRAVRLTNLFFIILSDINYFKLDYRGEPVMLADLGQLWEGVTVLRHYHLRIPLWLLFVNVLTLSLIPVLFRSVRLQLSGKRRIAASLASLLLFSGWVHCYFNMPYREDYRTDSMYQYAGFLRGIWAARPHPMEVPEGYDPHDVQTLLALYEEDVSDPPSQIHPDIFFIMCESLYDIAESRTQVLSEDPLAPLKNRTDLSFCGSLLSSSFGGGTFNVEYEVLTGYRCQDISGNLFNNRAAIYRGMDTVAKALKDLGYTTEAFHSNTGRFYNRNIDYPLMGFDNAYFPYDGLDAERDEIRDWLTNRWLLRQVLEKYDAAGTAPYFAHIVTTEGHGGFEFDWSVPGIEVLSPSEEPFHRSARTYANITRDAVNALCEFLDALSARQRPAVVVIWGDHCPGFGEFGTQMPEDSLSLAPYYKTPLFIWNNYGADISPSEALLPSYRLGAWTLHALGLAKDPYFAYLANATEPDLLVRLHLLEKDGQFFVDDNLFNRLDLELKSMHYYRLQGRGGRQ